ncbi:MAG TPA: hypothetical protein PLZ57_13360 [Pseudobdellovibrionaceae bacterium]|nr:hypothetical protein [Pseudobdellovibrionaceae bacterium]
MTAERNLTLSQASVGLEKHLKKAKLGNIHRSDRYKTAVNFYSILGLIKTDEGGSSEYLGHVCGPKVMEVKYSVIFAQGQRPQITILNKVENLATAIQMAEDELIGLHQRSLSQSPGKYNTKHWQGFYLWSEVAGKTGLQNLNEAKTQGLVTDNFIQTCLKIRMSMRKY